MSLETSWFFIKIFFLQIIFGNFQKRKKFKSMEKTYTHGIFFRLRRIFFSFVSQREGMRGFWWRKQKDYPNKLKPNNLNFEEKNFEISFERYDFQDSLKIMRQWGVLVLIKFDFSLNHFYDCSVWNWFHFSSFISLIFSHQGRSIQVWEDLLC